MELSNAVKRFEPEDPACTAIAAARAAQEEWDRRAKEEWERKIKECEGLASLRQTGQT